jgi:hypothetical protein
MLDGFNGIYFLFELVIDVETGIVTKLNFKLNVVMITL